MKKTSNKGFTLVELIIVIAILAIIMLIAIPNFSGIQQRMQVRADKATAAQIGKAVRIWYTEYQSDPAFKAVVGSETVPPAGEKMVPLNKIKSIDGFVDSTLVPTSLRKENETTDEGQTYVVGFTGSGTYEKVIVSIVTSKRTGTAPSYDYTLTDTPAASYTSPAANTDGTPKLNAKTSPKYDGSYIKPASATFEASLAWMEP